MPQPGFVVLYRWKLKPGCEEAFTEAWAEMTSVLLARGSLGSRLHHGHDDTWYAYAQWPSEQAREAAFESPLPSNDAGDRMDAAVAERFPEIVLDVVADFLVDRDDPRFNSASAP
jgi:heme-degrading monooxygenase HmoA